MKLAIAETGIPPHHLTETYGRYPGEMLKMLAKAGLEPDVEVASVHEGAPVPEPHSTDALLITGSPTGVYDGYEWITSLAQSVRDWAASGKPVLGICFGHQIMAMAMGGKVEKSNKGWGVGVHTYELVGETGLADQPTRISCVVSHQDQVVEVPKCAVRLGGSPFCPNGIIQYRDARMLSFQMHPEFDHDFARALLEFRKGNMSAEVIELADAGFSHPTDRALMGRWIVSFFKGEI